MSPIDERLKSHNIVLPDVIPPVVDGYVPAFAPLFGMIGGLAGLGMGAVCR